MRKFFLGVFSLALIGAIVVPRPVSAGVTTAYVNSLGSGLEHFNDSSFETAVHADGTAVTGVLGVGDILTGVFRIDSIGISGGTIGVDRRFTGNATQPEVTGVFAAEVVSKTGSLATGFTFTFAPTASFTAIYGTGALAALFEDPANNFVGNASIATSTASADGGLLLAVVGFTGAGGTAAAFEGWRATTSLDDISVASTVGASAFGNYQANLNEVNPADFAALDIPKTQFSTFAPFPASFGLTQFNVNGQLFGDTTSAAGSWNLSDSTDIFFSVHAVPEPASLAIFGVMLGGLLVVGRSRRNRKVAE